MATKDGQIEVPIETAVVHEQIGELGIGERHTLPESTVEDAQTEHQLQKAIAQDCCNRMGDVIQLELDKIVAYSTPGMASLRNRLLFLKGHLIALLENELK